MAKIQVKDLISCPYCGKRGLVANAYPDGTYTISHRIIERAVKSQTTGLPVRCMVAEFCYRGVEKKVLS